MAKRRANGEGSIRKRKDGRWEGRYTAGYDPETGKRIIKNVLGKTQAEVKEKLKLAVADNEKIDVNKNKDLTVGQWATLWFENYAKPSIRESTAEYYRNYIEKHIIPRIGKIKLKKLTTLDIQKFYNETRESGRVQRYEGMANLGLSNKTIRGLHAMLRQCLEQAVQERLIPYNPAANCKLPPKEKKEMEIIPPEKLGAYLKAAEEHGVLPMFYLELTTGLRRGELLALLWTDLNIKEKCLTVSKSVSRGKGELRVTEPKTKNSIRTVYIDDEAIRLLIEDHKKYPLNPYMFPSPVTGGMYGPDCVARMHKQLLKKAGIEEHVRFHDLRRTFATLALQNGVDLKTVSRMLGHYSAEFTLDVYTNVTKDMQREAAEKIGGFMSEIVEAENGATPVEAENRTWYNPLKGYGLRHSPFLLRRYIHMARKSRKHPNIDLIVKPSRCTVGYIRLSVRDKDSAGSIENQRLIIEEWGYQHQTPIMHYYIDNGFGGSRFDRPAFQQMIQDILADKIECIVVKDLSRLGRDHITVGYHLEIFFPRQRVRFVSVNDQFDTIDGITNQNKDVPIQSRVRIPFINLFNEQASIETKTKVKESLDMKAQRGEFIGPRAPFGYKRSSENPNQLVPDPAAAIIVQKIFEMAASGTGVTGIVRYLNERGLPTPIQYARSNGLSGNYDDGDGNWNSRSVKYILTNRTYIGMLVQGKEKRVVEATHEPLVDSGTFDAIQKAFQSRAYNVVPKGQSADNILKGKVICGCCGGKMQRKRGTGHADWYFFTCITKNRLGADKCTGMYAREEDVFNAIYRQLKDYVSEHYIVDSQYKKRVQQFNDKIYALAQSNEDAWANAIKHYEQFVRGEISKEMLRVALDAAKDAKAVLAEVSGQKAAYDKEYSTFRKLLAASDKRIPLSEIMDCIEKIIVDAGKQIVVKWV